MTGGTTSRRSRRKLRDLQRNMPRAFILGTVIVGTLYVFANLTYYYVLTLHGNRERLDVVVRSMATEVN